jgi:thymidylate synthase
MAAETAPSADAQYNALVRRVLDTGVPRPTRTGVPALACFGAQLRFCDVGERFPALTGKRVFWRGVVEELLWMLRGCTDATELARRGVHIWDANATPEFLQSRGLDYPAGQLGPVYGSQWRAWESKDGRVVDQLQNVVNQLRRDPTDRRMYVSAWNVGELDRMALPPCHHGFQFYAEPSRDSVGDARWRLSLMWNQRSCDLGLGIPFNIASYALLLSIVARVVNMDVGDLVGSLGDCHVYETHVDALRCQLQRDPSPSPMLSMPAFRSIDEAAACDAGEFRLLNYKPGPRLDMPLAV